MLLDKKAGYFCGRRIGLICLAGVLGLLGGLGCKSEPQTSADATPPPARVAGILLEQLHQAGLRLQWKTSVPLGRSQRLQQIFYHNEMLYALTGDNVLYAFGGKDGIVKWSAIVAEQGLVCSRPSWYNGHMLFVAGNQIVEVRQGDGEITRKITLGFNPVTNAVRTEKYLYVGSEGRQFYCIRLADEVPFWQAISPEPPTGAIAVDEDRCYFTRSDETLYVSRAMQRELVWSAAMKGNSPGVLVEAGQCLLPSEDTALYCFDAATGAPLWKNLLGSALMELPAVTKTAVYQPVRHRCLACLNRADGTLLWELPGGLQVLAEKGDAAYALTRNGEITLMDNRTGQRRLALPMSSLSLCAENTQDAGIFLSTSDGGLIALIPRE